MKTASMRPEGPDPIISIIGLITLLLFFFWLFGGFEE